MSGNDSFLHLIEYPDISFQSFLDSIETVLNLTLPRGGKVVVIGDFNAKVGSAQLGETFVGKHGLGNRNDRGQALVDFCVANSCLLSVADFKSGIRENGLGFRPTC